MLFKINLTGPKIHFKINKIILTYENILFHHLKFNCHVTQQGAKQKAQISKFKYRFFYKSFVNNYYIKKSYITKTNL